MKKLRYEDITDEELFYMMCRQKTNEKVTGGRRCLNAAHDSFSRQQMLRQQQEAALLSLFMAQKK